MLRRSPIKRKTPLRRSALLPKLQQLAGGWAKRRRDTGPSPAVRQLVWNRSDGACEWPECPSMATDVHHRLNRKMGGRKGEMAVLLNSPANLLGACRPHHEAVTSAHGRALTEARVKGWVLLEGEDGRCVPVLTRHGLVLLDDYGNWREV